MEENKSVQWENKEENKEEREKKKDVSSVTNFWKILQIHKGTSNDIVNKWSH